MTSTANASSIQDRIQRLKDTSSTSGQTDSSSSVSQPRLLRPSSQQPGEFFVSQQLPNDTNDASGKDTGSGKPNLIAPISISQNNSRGVFIRPQSTASYPMPLTALPQSGATTTTSKTAPFQKTIISDSYFISHNRFSISVLPISLTNESTKVSTDDNFHFNQADKPCASAVLRFSLHTFSQADQNYLKALPNGPKLTEIDEVGTLGVPNEWGIDHLLDRPLPLLTPVDLSNLPSTNSLVSSDHAAVLQTWLSQHSTNSKDFNSYHIVSLTATMQLDCVSSLRYIPCSTSCQCMIPASQKLTLTKTDKTPTLRKAFQQQLQLHAKEAPFNPNSLSASLLTAAIPESTIIDLTDPAFVSLYIAPKLDAKSPIPQATPSKRTLTPSILDITPLSVTHNTFLLATDTSTTMVVKVVQGLIIPILSIDPFCNFVQSTALHNILKHYTDQSITQLFPISSNPDNTLIKQPKGQIIVTAISASPTSKHNLIAISYALYPESYQHPNSNIVPFYQCVVLYSGQTLLPILPLFYNPTQQPVLLFEHDMLSETPIPSQPSTFIPQHFIKGMPFAEQIICIELSKSGLHLLITTSQNNLYILSLFTNQWIRYLGESSASSASINNTSLAPTIFTPSTLILKDAIRFVSSDTSSGSEYKLDPSGLYDHIPYILTLLPHGRNDIKEQNEKLFTTITGYSNVDNATTKRQIAEYRTQLEVLSNTQIRVTGINTNIRFAAVNTDKKKNRSVTLMSFDTHSVIPHSSDSKNDSISDVQQITPTHSKQGLYGGVIAFGKQIESHYSFSSLKLPRVELVNSKRNMMAFDHVRKILFIASCAGDKELFCVEVHKKYFTELNIPQVQTKGHKEAARRASIINPMNIGNQTGTQIVGEESANGELSQYLPYVTAYRPYTLSLHFLNKHTLVHPILDMTLRYSKQSNSSWPFFITVRTATSNIQQSSTGHVGITSSSVNAQKEQVLCVEVLELKRRAGVLTSSHRDSIFQFNATKAKSPLESDGNINYSKSGRNKAFEGRKMTRFTTGLNLKQQYVGFVGNFGNDTGPNNKAVQPSINSTIQHMSSVNNIFFVSNLQSIQSQLLHCDCGSTDIIYQYQQQLSSTKDKLKILPLGQENIQHHLMFQQKEKQQRQRHDSLLFGQPIIATTVVPGAPEVAVISEDQIQVRSQVVPGAKSPLNHPTIQPSSTTTAAKTPQYSQEAREMYDLLEELDDTDEQSTEPEDNVPYSIPYYDDPQFRPPPPAQFNVGNEVRGDKWKYDENSRALQMSQSDIELSHLNIQHGLNAKFGINTSVGYDHILSDYQVIETVYRDQVMDLQTQLSTTYIELNTLHEANTILRNENTFVRHENRLLQQQRDMLLDILKLRIEDLYSNNIYSNAYQLNQHEAQLNGTSQLATLQWDYNQTYIDFYNHYNMAYMMGKSVNSGAVQTVDKITSSSSSFKDEDDDESSSSPQIKGMKGTLGALFGKKITTTAAKHDKNESNKDDKSTPQLSAVDPSSPNTPSAAPLVGNGDMSNLNLNTNRTSSSNSNSASAGAVDPPAPANSQVSAAARQRVKQEQDQSYLEKQRRYEATTLKTSQRAKIVGTAPTLGSLFDDGDEDLDCMLTHNPLQSTDPKAEEAILALSPSHSRQGAAPKGKHFFPDDSDAAKSPHSLSKPLTPTSTSKSTILPPPGDDDLVPSQPPREFDINAASSPLTPAEPITASTPPTPASTPSTNSKPKFIFLKNGKLETNTSNTSDNSPVSPDQSDTPPPPPPEEDDDCDELRDSITQLLPPVAQPQALTQQTNSQPQPQPQPKPQRPQRQSILDKAKYGKQAETNQEVNALSLKKDNLPSKMSISVLSPVSSLSTAMHTNDNDIYVSYSVSKTGHKQPRLKTKEEKSVSDSAFLPQANDPTRDSSNLIDPLCEPETKDMVFQHIIQHEKQLAELYAKYQSFQYQQELSLLSQRPTMLTYKPGCTSDGKQQEQLLFALQQKDVIETNSLTRVPSSSTIKSRSNTSTQDDPDDDDDDDGGRGDTTHSVADPTVTPEFGNLHANVIEQHLHDAIHAHTFAEIESLIEMYHKTNEHVLESTRLQKGAKANNIAYTSNPLFQGPSTPQPSKPAMNESKKPSRSQKHSVFDDYRRGSLLHRNTATNSLKPHTKSDSTALFDSLHSQLAQAQLPEKRKKK